MNQKFKIFYLLIILLGLFTLQSSAASRYFKSGATTWNNANNWSATSSAGVDNAGVPTSADIAYFDSGSGSCTIDANVDVLGLDTTGYTGTITQGTYNIQVRGSNLSWVAGTFSGGSGTITVTGSFTQSGGTFTSTSNTFTSNNHFHLTSGTFNHNNGTVSVATGTNATITSGNFYNLIINKSTFALTITNNCIVANTLTISAAGTLTGSNIEARGNIILNSSNSQGTIKIIVNGTGNQDCSGTGNAGVNFEINKASGTLNFTTDIGFQRDYTYTAGTVNWNTKIATFLNLTNSVITNGTFYDLTINKPTFSLTITNTCTVSHNLIISGLTSISGSNIEVFGDIAFNSTSSAGTNYIIVKGTGTQNVSGTGGCPIHFEINKPSGTINFTSNVSFYQHYTNSAGTVNWNTYKATFSGSSHITITNGTFYDMEIAKNSSYNLTLAGANCIVANNFTFTSINTLANFGVEVRGNLTLNHNASAGNTSKIIVNGTGNQSVSGVCSPVPFEINKASGTLTFTSNLTFNSHYTNTAGTISWGTNKATFSGGANCTITNGAFYDAEIAKGGAVTANIAGSDMVVTNILTLNTTSTISGLNIIFNSSLVITGTPGASGSNKILPASTGDQTISGTGSLGCTLEINKSSGSVTFNANYNGVNGTYGDINIISGTVNQNGFNITAGKNINVTGGTFNGSAGNITCTKFIQTGGVFTSCSGTLQIGASNSGFNLDISGGIYNHNNGLVKCSGANHTNVRNLQAYPLWNFEASNCGTCSTSVSGTSSLFIENDLTITNTSTANTLIAEVKGNYTAVAGSASVTFTGGNNQTVTGNVINAVKIDKSGGTLTFNNDITVAMGGGY